MDSIPLEKEFIGAIEDIVRFLRGKDYSRVVQLPYKKGNIFSVINDLGFFLGRKEAMFKSSFLYRLRRWLFSDKELMVLCDFFMQNKKASYSRVSSFLGDEKVRDLLKLNILTAESQKDGNTLLKSQVRIIPFNGEYFVCDPLDRRIPDFVWIGSDSILLAERLKRLNCDGKLAIDIGSGSGIQAIALSTGPNTRVIAIDINEKGLRYAKLNAIINKKPNIRFVRSDMLSAIRGRIDTIVSNPPFVFLPPSEETVNRDGYGGAYGIEKTIYILERIPQYLNPGGKAVLLTLSPVISGKNILMEEVKRIFDGNYAIDYEIIDYVYMSGLKKLYDSENISYFIQGILKVLKNGAGGHAVQISAQDIPRIKKMLSFIKIIGKKTFAKNHADAV